MLERKVDPLIVLLGPTAVGKTRLAVELAFKVDGEVISADSRQVYKEMDIGTGKDLSEYQKEGEKVPYHLINIKAAGEEYDVFTFQNDFYDIVKEIRSRAKVPILCGGTGMYLEAALRPTQLLKVPKNDKLRAKLQSLSMLELENELKKRRKTIHNTTDLTDRNRLIRAIEIAEGELNHYAEASPIGNDYLIFGLKLERDKLRERIKERLDRRLKEGMIQEVESLLKSGLSKEKLFYYGLEYRYLSEFLHNELTYDQMYEKLLQAIRRFAKKQMTWFRRMERQEYQIHWLDATNELKVNIDHLMKQYERSVV